MLEVVSEEGLVAAVNNPEVSAKSRESSRATWQRQDRELKFIIDYLVSDTLPDDKKVKEFNLSC